MGGSASRFRRMQQRFLSTTDGGIHLNAPPVNSFKKANLISALGFIGIVALTLQIGSRVLRPQSGEDEIQIVSVAPPPPPASVQLKLQPKPIMPDPDEQPQPLPPKDVPPPVFGMPDDATNKGGDLAVATGNTLIKAADSVVQKAPPPLPSVPVELDREPAVLKQVVPEYPGWAEEQGVTATVKLQVVIDPQGRVQNVAPLSPGDNDFIRNAVKAVKATRFQPLVKDGVALAARFVFTFQYVL